MCKGKDFSICFHTVFQVETPGEIALRTVLSSNTVAVASSHVLFAIQYCSQLYTSLHSMAMELLDCNQFSANSCSYIDLPAPGTPIIGGGILCKHAQSLSPFIRCEVGAYASDNVLLVALLSVNNKFDSLANEQKVHLNNCGVLLNKYWQKLKIGGMSDG